MSSTPLTTPAGASDPTPAIDPSDHDTDMAARLRLSATRLARRLRQESDSGLTPTQLSALAAVERHGPVTLGDLANHERVAPPTTTRVVAKLEADGLVSRQADPVDRRSSLVTATSAGTELIETTRTRKDAWLASRIAGLTPAERDRLDQALDVLDHLTEQAGR